MNSGSKRIKGRGAQHNPLNPFDRHHQERSHEEGIDLPEDRSSGNTERIEVFPKSIVNTVKSPDVGMDYSLNPYQGCEHGCTYCYARNSHNYWGYSAGLDFERKILVKKEAVQLLEAKLRELAWKPCAIALSGNTDCYQPIEKELEITRSLLQTFLEYRHPVGIITKNALVCRDLDILRKLNKLGLVKVVISITTLDEQLRRSMEPRTASIAKRFETVGKLSEAGIPVQVMMAPLIPGLNSHEIMPLVERAAARGARRVGYTVLRLNGAIADIFGRWLQTYYPDRAEKVLHQISELHGGVLSDSRFGKRMKGEGNLAKMIADTFRIARQRYLGEQDWPEYQTQHFSIPAKPGDQMRMF